MIPTKNEGPAYDSKFFNTCNICGGSIRLKYTGLKDRLETTSDTFSLAECTECGIGFLNPMPVGNASAFYPDHYLSSGSNDKKNETNKIDLERWYRFNQYRFDFNLFLDATGMEIQDSSSYLDIGCGSGERVSYVKEMGCPVSAGLDKFDFIKNELNLDFEIINSDIMEFRPARKFQTVSLAHVLEHLEDPLEILLHIKEHILEEKGYLFIQVPNYGSLERNIYKSKWFCLDAPRHLWHFDRKSLQSILSRSGYNIKGTYMVNAPLHPVSIVPSTFRNLDVQRIWTDHSHGPLYKNIMKVLWAGLTIGAVPLNMLQNLLKRGSMLTIIASNEGDPGLFQKP